MERVDLDKLEALARAATPRAPHYAHPESEPAKATRALDAATRNALPALIARLRALEAVASVVSGLLDDRDAGIAIGRYSLVNGAPETALREADAEALRAALAAAKEG